MIKSLPAAPASRWAVTLEPDVCANAAWRARLLERLRPRVELRLRQRPDTRDFALTDSLFTVRVRPLTGLWRPGTRIELEYQSERPSPRTSDATEPFSRRDLPDVRLEQIGAGLVGLDSIMATLRLHLECRWSDRLERWSHKTGHVLPDPLREHLQRSSACFVLAGDPGTGKTTTAMVAADRYCRESGQRGVLLSLSTAETRGNGLVGDFGRRLTAAFEAAAGAAVNGPCFVLCDEGDSLAVARSGECSHHEDKAGTSALIQALDSLHGSRVAVLITTNLPEAIDAAVRRRAVQVEFPRPDREMRRALLLRWFPRSDSGFLEKAAGAADDLTPADLAKALTDVHLQAIAAGVAPDFGLVLDALTQARRTGQV